MNRYMNTYNAIAANINASSAAANIRMVMTVLSPPRACPPRHAERVAIATSLRYPPALLGDKWRVSRDGYLVIAPAPVPDPRSRRPVAGQSVRADRGDW